MRGIKMGIMALSLFVSGCAEMVYYNNSYPLSEQDMYRAKDELLCRNYAMANAPQSPQLPVSYGNQPDAITGTGTIVSSSGGVGNYTYVEQRIPQSRGNDFFESYAQAAALMARADANYLYQQMYESCLTARGWRKVSVESLEQAQQSVAQPVVAAPEERPGVQGFLGELKEKYPLSSSEIEDME